MSDILVITHSADLDGQCSQAIARRVLGDKADYLPWDYGRPAPDLTPYAAVYMLDISLPVEVMREHAAKIVLLDHHRTAIEATQPFASSFKGYYCIEGVAACRLAWQWFNGPNEWGTVEELSAKEDYLGRQVTEPYAVQWLGEHDIWDHRDPDTLLFQLGMQAQEAPNWDRLLQMPDQMVSAVEEHAQAVYHEEILEAGRAIQRYTEVTNAQIAIERGFDVDWEGLHWRALCTARCNSLTFAAALRPEHDGCLAYHWNGRAWRFSLYHAPGHEHHDLSRIAAKHGGGGHKGAAGGSFTVLPIELGGQR